MDASQQSVSKLRARSAALQAESHPRYKGKKVLRKDLSKSKQVEFDPELTKYFAIEDDGGDDDAEEEPEHDGHEEEGSAMESDNEVEQSEYSSNQEVMTAESDNESAEDNDEIDDSEVDAMIHKYHHQTELKGVT